jgi:hypothetical protein
MIVPVRRDSPRCCCTPAVWLPAGYASEAPSQAAYGPPSAPLSVFMFGAANSFRDVSADGWASHQLRRPRTNACTENPVSVRCSARLRPPLDTCQRFLLDMSRPFRIGCATTFIRSGSASSQLEIDTELSPGRTSTAVRRRQQQMERHVEDAREARPKHEQGPARRLSGSLFATPGSTVRRTAGASQGRGWGTGLTVRSSGQPATLAAPQGATGPRLSVCLLAPLRLSARRGSHAPSPQLANMPRFPGVYMSANPTADTGPPGLTDSVQLAPMYLSAGTCARSGHVHPRHGLPPTRAYRTASPPHAQRASNTRPTPPARFRTPLWAPLDGRSRLRLSDAFPPPRLGTPRRYARWRRRALHSSPPTLHALNPAVPSRASSPSRCVRRGPE